MNDVLKLNFGRVVVLLMVFVLIRLLLWWKVGFRSLWGNMFVLLVLIRGLNVG